MTNLLSLPLGAPGTYVVGVSTKTREIELGAEAFNAYVEEDGIAGVLEARRRDNELGKGAREQYSKHVKAVFQVGRDRSDGFNVTLGYPAEIVPIDNPYGRVRGGRLRFPCLMGGRPGANRTRLPGGE